MNILDLFKIKNTAINDNNIIDNVKSDFIGRNGDAGTYRTLFNISFNGEKNLGEIGPALKYTLDHETLSVRSWQAFLDSEVCQTVIKKYVNWVIGSGLSLRCEPAIEILKSEGIEFDFEKFNNFIEYKFDLYSSSKMSSFSGMDNLHIIAAEALKNAIISGDVLVIIRFVNLVPKIQIIDGCHIQAPIGTIPSDGNIIKNGIEMDANGTHIFYYVKTAKGNEKIPAKLKNGLDTAFLVYGLKYRIDNNRGIPLISVVMEKLKKLDRYSEAVLGSAEERQKIAFAIEHQNYSNGENPLAERMVKAFNVNSQDDFPKTIDGEVLARNIATTTNKQAINLPIGASLKSFESKNELYFKDFFSVHIDLICAVMEIPPNVAMSKYDSNYSASRAAIKEWEHTIKNSRKLFSFQFHQPIFNYWLESEILQNKVQAPGYLKARTQFNEYIIESYRKTRWVGSNVPHIDPVKEVEAERLKLGKGAENIPLSTLEESIERLDGGDVEQIMNQFKDEYDQYKKIGIQIDKNTNTNQNPNQNQ